MFLKWILGWALDNQVRSALNRAGITLPPMRKGLLGTLGSFMSLWQLLPVAWKLFRDPRVPILYKAIPVVTLLYVIAPWSLGLDLIPVVGEINAGGAIIIGLTAFIRMAAGHMQKQPNIYDQQTQRWVTPPAPTNGRYTPTPQERVRS